MPAPAHPNESLRLAALWRYRILDTVSEPLFDDVTRLAAQLCGAPISLVSLVDQERQWFKSRVGIGSSETPRDLSFCAHAILANDVFVVPDASVDPRFSDNALVTGEPHIRFYAGAPLIGRGGYALGTLCVIDREPRQLSPEQLDGLQILARQVVSQMELRLQNQSLQERVEVQRGNEDALSLQVAQLVEQAKLLDLAHDAILVRSLQGTIDFWSHGAELLYGWSKREVAEQPSYEILHTVFPESMEAIRETLLKEDRWDGELTQVTKAGHQVQVDSRWTLQRDMTGAPVAILEINCDITERRRALSAAREAREAAEQQSKQLRRLVETAPVAMAMFDREMHYLVCSARWLETFEPTDRDVVGRSHYEAYRQIPERWKAIHRRALAGESVFFPEERYQYPDGSFHYVRGVVQPWRKLDGEIGGLIIVADDIDELVRAREAALAASTAKSEFLASMSHEIRTPMNAIIGMADLLGESQLDPTQQEYIRILKRAGDTLLTLIDDVLDLSKVEAGMLEIEHVEFDLAEVLDRAAEVAALRAHEKGLELICHVGREVPMRVVGDPHRLRQVLLNLLGNAVKFTDRGEVVLRVRRLREDPAGVLRFSVTDTGVGVPEEKQATIFDSFTQADSSTTRRYGGSGLGLTITKRIVERMEGKVWLESRLGEGSCFTFSASLPASRPDILYARTPSAGHRALSGTRVLVVDDNATNRLILRETLASWGCSVTECESGRAGVTAFQEAKARSAPFEVVLLDCHMPEMDGFTVAEELRRIADCERTTVMMLTSGNRGSDLIRAREVGLKAYLIKPVKRQDLLDAILSATQMRAPCPPETPAPALAPRLPDHRRQILLVEDSADNRALFLAYLRGSAYDVEVAEDGAQAVAAYAPGRFDLILMDMQMPVMDGYTATAIIRERERSAGGAPIPIIALTANAFHEDASRSLAAGCTQHVTKPIRKAALLEKLAAFLSGRSEAEPDRLPG
jgi:PAS domain S-box-containing protein